MVFFCFVVSPNADVYWLHQSARELCRPNMVFVHPSTCHADVPVPWQQVPSDMNCMSGTLNLQFNLLEYWNPCYKLQMSCILNALVLVHMHSQKTNCLDFWNGYRFILFYNPPIGLIFESFPCGSGNDVLVTSSICSSLLVISSHLVLAAWSDGFRSGACAAGLLCLQQERGAGCKLSFGSYAWVWRLICKHNWNRFFNQLLLCL